MTSKEEAIANILSSYKNIGWENLSVNGRFDDYPAPDTSENILLCINNCREIGSLVAYEFFSKIVREHPNDSLAWVCFAYACGSKPNPDADTANELENAIERALELKSPYVEVTTDGLSISSPF